MGVTITGAVLVEKGDADVEPVTFGYRGVVYRVNLDERDRDILNDIFTRYIALAEAVGECGLEGDSSS